MSDVVNGNIDLFKTPFQAVFEGVIGNPVYSDLAVDDIGITQGSCGNPGDCDFEHDTCTWSNTKSGDQFDWLRQKGQTASTRTGPQYDHTIGAVTGKMKGKVKVDSSD